MFALATPAIPSEWRVFSKDSFISIDAATAVEKHPYVT